jgi:hypothetical protein
MTNVKIGTVIRTGIITAFTFVTALIWKDVLISAIEKFFPASDALKYEFYLAIIATFILILIIYIVFKTESEIEYLVERVKRAEAEKKKCKPVKKR